MSGRVHGPLCLCITCKTKRRTRDRAKIVGQLSIETAKRVEAAGENSKRAIRKADAREAMDLDLLRTDRLVDGIERARGRAWHDPDAERLVQLTTVEGFTLAGAIAQIEEEKRTGRNDS